MIEEYLHFIWDKKRLSIKDLKTTNGDDLHISNFGKLNRINSGPDFSMGTVVIGGVEIHGPIEMHVKSSDWYVHKHHLDKAYDNVILHVVYEHNKEVVQNNWSIPTLELKDRLDQMHFLAYKRKKLNLHSFVCQGGVGIDVRDEFDEMKQESYKFKLDQKCKEYLPQFIRQPKEVFYQLLARAFGVGANKKSFQMLSKKINFDELKGLSYQKAYKVLFFESGLILNEKISKDFKWDYCGTRPANFPEVRMMQLAQFIVAYQLDSSVFEKGSISMTNHVKCFLNEIYFNTLNGEKKPGKLFYAHLMINVFAPFQYMASLSNKGTKNHEEIIDLLKVIPAEKNSIIKKYKDVEVRIDSAFASQAILSLYENYCSQKKCLSCAVGKKILRN